MNVLFKPLSMAASILGGVLAGAVFKQVWKAVSGDKDAPEATSSEHRTREVLLAAVLQGAIFGGVKAAVDRASAKGIDKLATAKPKHGH
ncbi:DUF4235 domain-containing protein [Amycolatopsis pigmentata]|uniref:DUF4235 domain-containing protein n=1 Tax=Amycolatopsis pigmentata TaxID=450801 RepID=A0ABW5FPM0_9PSEU